MRSSKTNLTEAYACKIRLLDDVEMSFEFKKETKGSALLDYISNELDLLEKDYFGLRYVDNNKQRHWLDGSKEVMKQLKECRQPYMFFFRVKFYPTDPTKLREEITRYYLYLQLKRDILHGRLLCPFNNITDLAAHVVQAEIGDYSEEEHGQSYLSNMKLLPRQNEKLEEKIMEYHKTLSGYNPAKAENRFLNLARSQDLYGVDPHPCKDQDDLPLYLGLTPQGIQIIREARRVSGFIWSDVNKVSYDNKIFYVQTISKKKKTNYAFRLNDTPSCKHLWKCAVEHMSFYSEEPIKAQVPKRSALSPQNIFRRSKYKFSGKTEHDLRSSTEQYNRSTPVAFERKSSLRASIQKNCLSMSNLEKIPQPYSSKQNSENRPEENGVPLDSQTQSTFSDQNPEQEDDLAEFETRDFPRDPESCRDSMMLDDVSTSSSLEMNNLPPVASTPQPPPPSINVENFDEPPVNGTAINTPASSTTPSSTMVNSTVREPDQQRPEPQPSIIATTTFTDLYKNPFFLLLLLAAAMIPVAIVLQMKFRSS